MQFDFNRGFLVYKANKNLDMAIVCPHSGPALVNATYRDDNSETVGSYLLKQIGGKLVISNMPRSRFWGIDFNRDIPDIKESEEMFNIFKKAKDLEKLYEYRKKYAWVAKSEKDYYNRLKIYQNFWSELDDVDTIILLHRSFPRIKSLPSLMDFIILGKLKVRRSLVKELVRQINSEYFPFLSKVGPHYKRMIMFESERVINTVLRTGRKFDIEKLDGDLKTNIGKDVEKIKEYADSYIIKRLRDNFTPQNYLAAVNSALKNSPKPEITFENTFDGSLSLGPKRKIDLLKHKLILEVEPSRFMNFWHPQTTAKIISKTIDKINRNI